MTHTDPELRAVLDLPAAEPTDASVSRTWHLLNRRHTAGRGRAPRRLSRLLIPVGAAAVVAAVTVGAILLNGLGGGNAQFGAPRTAEVLASHQPLPAERGTNPALSRSTPEALAALDELARTATTASAVTLGPGQLIHVRADGWASSQRGNEATAQIEYQGRERWVDPQGMIIVRLLSGEEDLLQGPKAEPTPDAVQRGDLEQFGPNLRRPTPEWLAQLPAGDPAALLARLRDDVDDNEKWTADHQLWDAMGEFYLNADLLLSPELRAGLLRAFRGMDGLTAGEVVVDGWRLIAIRQTDDRAGIEILFDPLTASAVGRRTMYAGSEITLIPPDGGPRFDPLVGYHVTWTQHLVNSVDER
ncbi:hypothetical protein CS0771_27000 [Catellatospora sp. IY07-71]|uniref:hypothetical protein n=1 Tax=Catellatospora sp. IY07-71 TaxID=2728827 RepID=UPI001BB3C577|nr:hypothetical protein [Catellatospora sp. IY07-71]BCJ73156.1 hypothetical protein CS0771_27000 [Catellatospora sp. IY07-71]